MSLARAFTQRIKRNHDSQTSPTRGASVKYAPGTIKRNLISLPTELISTTNVQALTAPDIRSASSGSSVTSGNESDFSTIDRSFLTNYNSDTSSIDSGPATPLTPPMDDIAFFEVKSGADDSPPLLGPMLLEAPAIPKRAPSHSKRAHVELSRKRSIQRMTPPPDTLSKPAMRTSADFFAPTTDPSHPFGNELAQVSEIAEEFGATKVLDEEEQELLSKGLFKFGVEDYLNEIVGLYGGVFENQLGPIANPWF